MKQQALALSTAICCGRRHVLKCTTSQNRLKSTATSTKESGDKSANAEDVARKKEAFDKLKKTHKSMADADEEMRQAMENLAGDGGEAGLELEDGKPVSMKRGVRENMFRYI
ncbi:hypothetical protein Z517_04967 [Fonsecaea pedrosoi CBS 271.37]|uniref:Uncharacterized protein n=1 Tax=Fonsecaea pedrosoi CBS 271.37 TaxID=1442368 RepID=A0A0D2DVX0_9EURO|nr:uncharacterized protein Z517_04967 [Fonsecaea pedrosoi CBS 271.37]KIW81941.1 hypothetical protein Z517_04967 [Fonsecaea pedrosoi CBS 271.37]